MTTFRYKGISRSGAKVSGVIKAYDEFEAVSELRETCAVITLVEEVRESKLAPKPLDGKGIKEKDLAMICSQFSIILTSGLSVVRCVEMVAAQTKNRALQRMLEKVAEDIGGGYSMAQSFENNAPGLPSTFIETIRAGEQSGTLERCFARLHRYFDKSAKIKAKLISALTYPAIVTLVAIIVFIIIMTKAVPMFTKVFGDMGTELPGVTRALIAVSNFITGYWWVAALIAGIWIAVSLLLRRTEGGKRLIFSRKLRHSPFGKLRTMNLSSQFADTMSTMLSAGLAITKALDITSAVMSNYVFGMAVRQVKQGVEQGRGISDCMGDSPYFPKLLTEMVGVGEQTGSMEETLGVVGDYFSNEVELTSNRLLSLLEPVITIVLAVFTVVLLLSIYLPMFNLYGSF